MNTVNGASLSLGNTSGTQWYVNTSSGYSGHWNNNNNRHVDEQWSSGFHGDINEVLAVHDGKQESYNGISKHHWKPNTYRERCSSCKKKFTLTNRYHHCRRCGDLFCGDCLSYQRRLNHLAHPDPNGKLHKVCRVCFDQGPQTVGQTRSWSTAFVTLRRGSSGVTAEADGKSLNFRGRVNLKAECQRLKEGFLQNVSVPSWRKTISDVKSLVSVPEWQKSTNWVYGNMAPMCFVCRLEFNLTRGRHLCKVCGSAVCQPCSTNDLIVFLPDQRSRDQTQENQREPQMYLIKIVGCPAKEPEVCLYLRVCPTCQQALEDIQVEEYRTSLSDASEELDFLQEVVSVWDRFCCVQHKIDDHMPKYQQLIEALETAEVANAQVPRFKSNTQTLAKAQCDLADHLTAIVVEIQSMKKLKPGSQTQALLLRNLIRGKCEYYHENMFLFRDLKKRLQEITPADVLTCIQSIVDKNAINSSYLSIKQLAFEVLYLSDKHSLNRDLVQHLIQAEQVIQEDLKVCLSKCGENWEEHDKYANQLLQIQLKEHRLIRPSRRLTKELGGAHIEAVILNRGQKITRQILLQFKAKASDRSFQTSKQMLDKLKDHLTSLQRKK